MDNSNPSFVSPISHSRFPNSYIKKAAPDFHKQGSAVTNYEKTVSLTNALSGELKEFFCHSDNAKVRIANKRAKRFTGKYANPPILSANPASQAGKRPRPKKTSKTLATPPPFCYLCTQIISTSTPRYDSILQDTAAERHRYPSGPYALHRRSTGTLLALWRGTTP